ncbi:aldehyde dehydrogenase family protein [Jiangella alba]|uniref:Aldehyde dehydrogenase (NAD+) n=1 Tax=Jiangella alba TaxID=561176 RepID=A0A1H5MME6_9ACTN|nr:aldehyde dehydrogenase family protein [Jiangella alba]SEE90476.1 aldehyde dehydrogenase (NAD+) [Jiangella alba]
MTTRQIRHLVAGTWTGEPATERRNPADPGDLVSVTAAGDAGLVDDAVAAATAAQPAWAALPGPARGRVLTGGGELLSARLDEVARDLTREEGKTLAEARGEVQRAADVLRFFGGEGWRSAGDIYPSSVPATLTYTRKEPLGVVAAITPWNFPIAIPAWKIAPALVAGNAVVLKPAGLTTVSTWHLARALVDAGLPSGVLNLVHGSGALLGDALVGHRDVAAVTFTGSTAVGLSIQARAAARRARVQTEMGGKNALVVLDDADPAVAARIAAAGGFALTGQACTATSRVVCTPKIAEAFTAALVEEAGRFAPGDGLADGVLMGPVVSESQLATGRSYLEIAEEDGGEVLTGRDPGDGLFQPPAVVAGVRPGHRIAREEVFGPVVSVLTATDLDEAIDIVNGVDYGLTAGLVSNDLRAVHRFVERAQAGVVKINRPTSGLDLNVPFGGVKDSSTNTYREQGAAAVDFFTWIKSVYLGHD